MGTFEGMKEWMDTCKSVFQLNGLLDVFVKNGLTTISGQDLRSCATCCKYCVPSSGIKFGSNDSSGSG